MNVLLAFDKFKDSLTAEEACRAAARALRDERPEWYLRFAPLTDGGDGFCRILTEAVGGKRVEYSVTGPRFHPTKAQIGWIDLPTLKLSLRQSLGIPHRGRLAIVEMAQSSGLAMLSPEHRDVWKTSSIGTGELLAVAARAGAAAILLGVGGSATNDLGIGALEALGLRFLASDGNVLTHLTPRHWRRVARVSGSIMEEVPPIRIACDVENPLLGANGAAAVFGPQKGLAKEAWPQLDEATGEMAALLCSAFDAPLEATTEKGSGAAGGIAFGLGVVCGARIVPGFELVATWLDLDDKLGWADLVITGEGGFDRASLQGKGPGRIIEMATKRQIPTWVYAGKVAEDLAKRRQLRSRAVELTTISPSHYPLHRSLAEASTLLEQSIRHRLSESRSDPATGREMQ